MPGDNSRSNPPASASRGAVILAFAIVYLVWGSTYLGIRVAIETMPPVLMAGMRFVISGVVVFTFLILRGAKWPTLKEWREQAVAGAFLLLGGNALVSWAEQKTPSGITALILGASPLMMVFLDWIRPGGRRPTLGLCLGVGMGIAGVGILLGPEAIPANQRPPALYSGAIIFSSLCWWIGSLYSKHLKSGTPPLMGAAMQMLTGSILILLVGLMLGEGSAVRLASFSTPSWIAFTYLVVVGSIVTYPVYVWLLGHSTPAKVSTYAYVNPVVAVFLGWAILGEPMNLRIILAAIVIIGAVAIITVGRSRDPTAK